VTPKALLEAADGAARGELKRLAAWLDDGADRAFREALVAAGRARGVDLPDDAVDWPGKKLLRRCRGEEAAAQVRKNPIHRDEGFVCAHCGADVPPHGRTARDHCPKCLRSLHVDVVPGDRAEDCGGILDPVGVEVHGDRTVLRYKCRTCGARRTNQAILDGEVPDDWAVVIALSATS